MIIVVVIVVVVDGSSYSIISCGSDSDSSGGSVG